MEDSSGQESASTAPAGRAAPRKRTASRKKPAAARRRSPARKKRASRARSSRRASGLQSFLGQAAARASAAGVSLAAFSGEGMERAREALGKAGSASRKTVEGLLDQWKRMDPRRRAQFLAALLGALAAASAPIVRSRIRKK